MNGQTQGCTAAVLRALDWDCCWTCCLSINQERTDGFVNLSAQTLRANGFSNEGRAFFSPVCGFVFDANREVEDNIRRRRHQPKTKRIAFRQLSPTMFFFVYIFFPLFADAEKDGFAIFFAANKNNPSLRHLSVHGFQNKRLVNVDS